MKHTHTYRAATAFLGYDGQDAAGHQTLNGWYYEAGYGRCRRIADTNYFEDGTVTTGMLLVARAIEPFFPDPSTYTADDIAEIHARQEADKRARESAEAERRRQYEIEVDKARAALAKLSPEERVLVLSYAEDINDGQND